MTAPKPDLSYIHEGLRSLAVPIDDVEPLDRNPRQGAVDEIAGSIKSFGIRSALVARKRDGGKPEITKGNNTWLAAKRLGLTHVPVLVCEDDEQTARAYALVDNRTHDLGTYDEGLLAEDLAAFQQIEEFSELAADLGWEPPTFDDGDLPEPPPDPSKADQTKFGFLIEFGSESDRQEFRAWLAKLEQASPDVKGHGNRVLQHIRQGD